jgi:hypothetical protein
MRAPAWRSLASSHLLGAGMIALPAAGALIVAVSYRMAQGGGSPAAYYAVFWAGALLLMAPFAAAALWDDASDNRRGLALLGLGVVTFIPKFLRNPYGPLYHDELAHYRAVNDLLATKHLYGQNPTITIIGDYPGLHIVTATLQQLSGLSFWQSASIAVLLFHCATLIAIYVAGRTLLRSGRIAALAAVLYATNPSYLYFHTQFAYESMAIALFVWVLALLVIGTRSHGGRRRAALASAVVLTVAMAMTHHLTTVTLIGFTALGLVACVIAPRRLGPAARREWVPWAVVLVTASAALVLWVLFVAHNTFDYLRPYATRATEQLFGQALGTGGGRTLYAGSVQPLYERALGGLAPLIMLALCLIALRRSRLFAGWDIRRTTLAIVGFGLIYFPSIPFILAPSGAEGARRSWGFTYIGVALCVAVCVAPWLWESTRRRRVVVIAALGLAGLVVGNTGAGLNDIYRFPGPYLFGSDTRSLTNEAVGLGEAFGEQYAGRRVVADRYSAMAVAAYGGAFTAAPSPGFPAYDLFFHARTPEPYLVHELESSGYEYVVVDSRLSRAVPATGTYFTNIEPLKAEGTRSVVPEAALRRFDTVPWATKVMATPHYSVYRLSFAAAGVPSCATPGCKVPAR